MIIGRVMKFEVKILFVFFSFFCVSGQSQETKKTEEYVLTKKDSALIDSMGLMVIDSDFNLITGDTVMSSMFNEHTLLVTDDNGDMVFIADSSGEYDEEYYNKTLDNEVLDSSKARFAEEIEIINNMKYLQNNDVSTNDLISDLMSDSAEADFIRNYYVIVGTGRSLPPLIKIQEEIIKIGYHTEIIQNDKKTWYHIALTELYTKSQSSETVFILRAQGFTEAWRMKLDL
ncbi:MAG: hypothetical protein ACJAUV_001336 [Flavobacteriales bacterium]|jgi:hypothetical protein